MKKRNVFKFFSITCMLLSLVLAGCDIGTSQPTAHSFRQEYDNIVKIGLLNAKTIVIIGMTAHSHFLVILAWYNGYITANINALV